MSGNGAHDTLTRRAKRGWGEPGAAAGMALLLLTAGTFNQDAFERATVENGMTRWHKIYVWRFYFPSARYRRSDPHREHCIRQLRVKP